MRYNKWVLLSVFLILFNSVNVFGLTANDPDTLAYYSFDGGSYLDSTSNGYDLTNTGGASVTTGIINDSYDYDGSTDYMRYTGGGILPLGDKSVSVWAKVDTLSAFSMILGETHSGSGNNEGFSLSVSTTDVYTSIGNGADANHYFEISVGSPISTGVWHHYVLIQNSTGYYLYIDGTLNTTDTVTEGTELVGDYNFTIGKSSNPAVNYYFDGQIDEISLWNKSLTSTEVTELYNSGTPTVFEQYPFTSQLFEITAISLWDSSTIFNFSADINGTLYSTTNGTINTNISSDSSNLYNITINKTDWFNKSYLTYNVSTNLIGIIFQTNITLDFLFDSGDYINFTNIILTDNTSSNSFNISAGTTNINPNLGGVNFSMTDGETLFANFTQVLTFSALEISTTNITVSVYDNILTFLNINDSSPIENATITVTYPSLKTQTLTTNSSGKIVFAYDYNGTLELGDYNFYINKTGFINQTFSEEINSSVVPFIKTYNVSNAELIINIYDRSTGVLLSGVSATINLVEVLNDTTSTGTYSNNNLSVISGEYAIYVSSTGYRTESRSFIFTNQEELTINFYLLNLSDPNYGTVTVATSDSFFREITDAEVNLYEYVPSSLSFVSVSECHSNIDGECDFAIELNTKTYYISATTTIGTTLFLAETSQNGEIFTTSGQIRNLIFYTRTDFTLSPLDNLIYSISETFVSNVSQITVNFNTYDGTAETVCVEYFIQDGVSYTSVTGDTYCVVASASLQNIGTSVTLNRSNSYQARIYLNQTTSQQILQTYNYPSITSTSVVFSDDLKGAVILIFWLIALGFSLHAKNMTLWFILAILLSWGEILIFPLYSIVSISVFKTVISIVTMMVARRRKDFE